MIQETIVHPCPKCGSHDLSKNGKHYKNGKQKYHCKACNAYGTLNPEPRYSESQKEESLRVYQERASLRGVERALGISRQTLATWLKKKSNGFLI